MKRYIIVLSYLMVTLSCGREVDNSEYAIPHSLEQCFDDVFVDESLFSIGCDEYTLDPSLYCDLEKLSNDLNFTEEELGWIPSFCCVPAQKIFYENLDGERVFMSLLSKRYDSSRTLASELGTCLNPDRSIIHCADCQRVQVDFSCPHLETDIAISLLRRMQVSQGEILWGAHIRITSLDQSGIVFNYETLLNAYVNPRDLEVDSFYDFHESIDLLGTEFKNVYSSSVIQQGTVKIYYNQAQGLVGFVDKQGMTWKIII